MEDFYVRSKSVVSRRVGEDTLVVPVRGGVGDLASIFSLNEVASVLWSVLERPASVDTLVREIEERFEVSSGRAEEDVKGFLSQMSSAGLVEVACVNALSENIGELAVMHSDVA